MTGTAVGSRFVIGVPQLNDQYFLKLAHFAIGVLYCITIDIYMYIGDPITSQKTQ